MPAISFVWSKSEGAPAGRLQDSMLAAQAMYGDGRRFCWCGEQVAMGGSLSNYLPEDCFDVQPLWGPDRSFCLAADVRLDNRAELARVLGLVHPEEMADSSVLMAAWLRWGAGCLDYLAGGFAFAVWTPARRELFAARDHVGERPLFYHRGDGIFAVASMPKGLLALPGVGAGMEEARVAEWMAWMQSDRDKSFFPGVTCVPAGHAVRMTPDSCVCERYWHPAEAAATRYRRDEDYAEALLEKLDEATEARLRSTKPVGSFLSAGLDSASVTASAAGLMARVGKRLTAFTAVPRAGFNGVSQPWLIASEGEAAAEVARMYPNIDHVLVDTLGCDLLGTMKAWTDAMDEPALNVVNLLWITKILGEAKARGVGVMLEGAMGNGTISWETGAILSRMFRRMRWMKLGKTVRSLRAHGDISYRGAARASLAGMLPGWFDRRLGPVNEVGSPALVGPETARKYSLEARMRDDANPQETDPLAAQARLFERFDFGPIHAAVQAVTGVEVRDPTADKRVYEFCFSIPQEQYVVGGHSRSLVRRAMKGRLPEATRLCYKRGHQGADWYMAMADAMEGIRGEVARIEECPAAAQVLDVAGMRRLLDTWPTEGYETKRVSELWHNALMRGVSMGYFLRSRRSLPRTITHP